MSINPKYFLDDLAVSPQISAIIIAITNTSINASIKFKLGIEEARPIDPMIPIQQMTSITILVTVDFLRIPIAKIVPITKFPIKITLSWLVVSLNMINTKTKFRIPTIVVTQKTTLKGIGNCR